MHLDYGLCWSVESLPIAGNLKAEQFRDNLSEIKGALDPQHASLRLTIDRNASCQDRAACAQPLSMLSESGGGIGESGGFCHSKCNA